MPCMASFFDAISELKNLYNVNSGNHLHSIGLYAFSYAMQDVVILSKKHKGYIMSTLQFAPTSKVNYSTTI